MWIQIHESSLTPCMFEISEIMREIKEEKEHVNRVQAATFSRQAQVTGEVHTDPKRTPKRK